MIFLIYDTNDTRVAELDEKGNATMMHDESLSALLDVWRTDGYRLLVDSGEYHETDIVDKAATYFFGKDDTEFQLFWNALADLGYSVYAV